MIPYPPPLLPGLPCPNRQRINRHRHQLVLTVLGKDVAAAIADRYGRRLDPFGSVGVVLIRLLVSP
jgi:hypothetical protein